MACFVLARMRMDWLTRGSVHPGSRAEPSAAAGSANIGATHPDALGPPEQMSFMTKTLREDIYKDILR